MDNPNELSTSAGLAATSSPPFPDTYVLPATLAADACTTNQCEELYMGVTRDDLSRHSDQMRQFLAPENNMPAPATPAQPLAAPRGAKRPHPDDDDSNPQPSSSAQWAAMAAFRRRRKRRATCGVEIYSPTIRYRWYQCPASLSSSMLSMCPQMVYVFWELALETEYGMVIESKLNLTIPRAAYITRTREL
ncbi:hypothetical protein PENSPDRAFT_649406 [Peniophora sp. CONT]|nr:hypothetical protein PENSPDRAFT_649406 [Peniophora sp. CONT]